MLAIGKEIRVLPCHSDWLVRGVKSGDIVQHFKGNLYQVSFVATHTETGERMVVYEPVMLVNNISDTSVVRLNNDKVYVRPYEMFTSKVDRDKYPEVPQEYRFELVEIAPEG